jgi:hypothetical protein
MPQVSLPAASPSQPSYSTHPDSHDSHQVSIDVENFWVHELYGESLFDRVRSCYRSLTHHQHVNDDDSKVYKMRFFPIPHA